MKASFFLLAATCVLSACSTVEYIGIETYNPAEITFPKSVGTVLIVNNAVPQPANAGYIHTLFGVKQDTARAYADSALFDACSALGKTIVDDSFFNDVLLYHDGTREDDSCLVDRKLTREVVEALCDETGADAVISFDRLLFLMTKDVSAFADGFVAGDIQVKMDGVVRSYLPGRENPLATVYVEDSIYWSEAVDDPAILDYYLPSPDAALRAAGQYIGARVTPNFIPHWEKELRWYFKGESARWKEATAYAQAEKWTEAASRWRSIYTHSSRWKEQAKAASNLALYYEMNTALKEAFEWASKSYDLFNENKGADYSQTKMQKIYAETLSQRIRSDQKLNKQFGQE